MQDVNRRNPLPSEERNMFWGEAWLRPVLVVAFQHHMDSSRLTSALWLFLHRVCLWCGLDRDGSL